MRDLKNWESIMVLYDRAIVGFEIVYCAEGRLLAVI